MPSAPLSHEQRLCHERPVIPSFSRRRVLCLVCVLWAAGCDEAGDIAQSDATYEPDTSSPPGVEGDYLDDDCPPGCDEMVESAAEQLCGEFLPPRVNVTTWPLERLTDEWTYHATEHNKRWLPVAPPTYTLHDDALAGQEAFEEWRAEGIEALERVLRLDTASWPDTPLDVRELSVEQREHYTLREIDYLVEPGQRVPAYLLIPRNLSEPAPGIVMWHGHSPEGKTAMVDESPDAFNRYHAGAHHLAIEGFVVLAPDVRSFGATGSMTQHEHFTSQLLLFGRVALGTFAADAMKAIDVLSASEHVDITRIGVGGTSLGGELALLSAVLDPRVDVAVVNGYLASYRGAMLGFLHCVCQYVPLMATSFDIADIAALAAPTPVHFVTGVSDTIFPVDEAQRAFEQLRPAWCVYGAERNVSLELHGGEHEWVHELALPHFDTVLRPSTPVPSPL
jgi:dienelactone hydrolase